MLDNGIVELFKSRNEASVAVFVYHLVALKNKGGENNDDGNNAENNALCHNKSYVLTE